MALAILGRLAEGLRFQDLDRGYAMLRAFGPKRVYYRRSINCSKTTASADGLAMLLQESNDKLVGDPR
ncbi:hypothetical protein DTW90_20560 [Neorhizobium sp. P12A]|nr:hypothetical protein DTW90_20560 [Neorhizobium sp. P12A]